MELLEARDPDSPIGKFVAKRGPGIHHICFAVDDLTATVERCRRAGIKLIDAVPRIGAEGKRIAFLHPSPRGVHGRTHRDSSFDAKSEAVQIDDRGYPSAGPRVSRTVDRQVLCFSSTLSNRSPVGGILTEHAVRFVREAP